MKYAVRPRERQREKGKGSCWELKERSMSGKLMKCSPCLNFKIQLTARIEFAVKILWGMKTPYRKNKFLIRDPVVVVVQFFIKVL